MAESDYWQKFWQRTASRRSIQAQVELTLTRGQPLPRRRLQQLQFHTSS